MIPFNIPCYIGTEEKYIREAIDNRQSWGKGVFVSQCQKWMESTFSCKKAFLTTSCTHAIEMAALLIDIKEGDEIIMPSYTFVSTANAFALRGARIVFVDIRADTMNIDDALIEEAITKKTKAIVVVHYAGIACNMEKISDICKRYKLFLIEDAAHGVMAKYKNQYLGTIGDVGCYSFHETKNYTCGVGGGIVVNNMDFVERAAIIREKGTDRAKFLKGEVDKYTWVDIGSSYFPGELNAAYLYGQLEGAEKINQNRLKSWNAYYEGLKNLEKEKLLELPTIPQNCEHNGHIFYIKTKDLSERTTLISFLKEKGIQATFHYGPLHLSLAGLKHGRFHGEDKFTTRESQRLLRLPLYYGLDDKVYQVIEAVMEFINA